MKILIIGPFPQPVFGVSLSNMVLKKGLTSRGFDVRAIDTATSTTIDSTQGAFSLRKLSFLKHYTRLYKVLSPDIIYCTTGQTFFGIIKYAPFVLLAKILNKSTIVHVKGGYIKASYENMSNLKRRISKFILKSYSKGIVLSSSLEPLLQDFLPPDKIFVQHNFIQDSLIISEDEVFKQKELKAVRVIFLSNLIPEKGIYQLLEALDVLNVNNIPFQAKVAGHIPNGHQDLIEKMNNIKNLEYVGIVKDRAKIDLLSWGNVFCLPTYYSMEGQPISILEAMGFGNVIITTKHAGIPDICSDKNAVFVEKKDVQSIVNKLKGLSNNINKIEQICRFNLTEARKLYSEKSFIDGIIKIMKSE